MTMPTTVEITGYTFQELTPQAKEQACLTLQPDNDCYWHEFIIDNAKEDGKALGFDIHNIYFSISYSQGDGASWVGTVDLIKWLEKHKPEDAAAHFLSALMENDWVDAYLNITANDPHYSHSSTMRRSDVSIQCEYENDTISMGMFEGANVSNLFDALPEDYADTVADEALESARSYADEIYERLRDEYEHMCSEEYIAELCDANEYLFTEKGKLL
jgi:hypothetical protein